MKCKYCQAEMDENSEVCPVCGKLNPKEEGSADEVMSAEETVPAEKDTKPEEAVSAEAVPSADNLSESSADAESGIPEKADSAPSTPKMTAGKLAGIIVLGVAVVAVVISLILAGVKGRKSDSDTSASIPAAEPSVSEASVPDLNVTEGTIPPDGNPDDVTCKGSYTVDDETLLSSKDTVVATIGDEKLTVSMLQIYYWMDFYEFLQNYSNYLPYFGLDYTQPLDKQACSIAKESMGEVTWQQYFLANALNTWQRYTAMSLEAKQASMDLEPELKELMDNIEHTMQEAAEKNGFSSAEAMLQGDVGAAGSLEDYKIYRQISYEGYQYFNHLYSELKPTEEDIEKFFQDHASEMEEQGITKESGNTVDVRHILIAPEGGTEDDSGNVTYSEEEWAACEKKAQDLLDSWLAGAHTEESFSALAAENSTDPGSKDKGGLYTGVRKGQMVEAFDSWCFDAARKPADSGLVKTEFGYHIMYFVGSTPIWREASESALMTELSGKMVDDVTSKYPMTVRYPDIVLSQVDQVSAS